MAEIGSYQWGQKTQGHLNPTEKFKIIGMLFKNQAIDVINRIRYALKIPPASRSNLNFDVIIRPDSKIALEAEALCQELHTPNLVNHCFRTYYWAVLLGQVDGLRTDLEMLYVGCLLHDMGLTDKHRPQANHACFALNGAAIAYNLALKHQWTDAQAQNLYNTIGLHITPMLTASKHGPEAKLLGNGAFLDVAGLRHYCLNVAVIKQVLQQYPRQNFTAELLQVMQNTDHPLDTRAGFMSNMGIEFLANRNPLDKLNN